MPTYTFGCDACEVCFDVRLSLSEFDTPQTCPECNGPCRRHITLPNFVLKGDDWVGKNLRIKGQMAAKNARLDRKQNEMKRDAPGMKLAPNVNGERVDSWRDAQKLAASQGKDTSSYEAKIREEKKT